MNSRALPSFWACFRALPDEIQRAAEKAYALFKANPAHPGLRLKRVARDPRAWSVRVTRDYRAVGFREEGTMVWFWIGTHQEFDRLFPT